VIYNIVIKENGARKRVNSGEREMERENLRKKVNEGERISKKNSNRKTKG
jgi:hypothetical protein